MKSMLINNKDHSRNYGVDILRSICMLYIVGYWHVYNYIDPIEGYRNVITDLLTRIALGVFFLLAGYYSGRGFEYHQKNMLDFYRNKILRIYPLYLITLGLFFLLKINSLRATVTGVLSLSMFVEPTPLTLWFITMLMVLYAIFPLLFRMFRHFSFISFLVVCISCLIILLGYEYFTGLLDIRFIMYSPSYVLGVIMSQRNVNVGLKNWILWILISISFGIVVATDEIQSRNWIGLSKIPVITLIAYVLVIWVMSFEIKSEMILKMAKWISYSSFCMYLFHRPIITLLLWIYHPDNVLLQLGYLILIGVPTVVLLSIFIQFSYDRSISKIMKPKALK